MHTSFTQQQLQDQTVARADQMLRRCVHCGLCTATCPTYVLLGDERDSPRGRIYLIKEMLETGKVTAPVTDHIDRCLSCLSCMTTCPSGVDYMHLVDLARERIEKSGTRSAADRTRRNILASVLPSPGRFRLALLLGWLTRPLRGLISGLGLRRTAAMLELVPAGLPHWKLRRRKAVFRTARPPQKRVALMLGCVQEVLAPSINRAAIRLLKRHGVEVALVKDESVCCGALQHQLGREEEVHKAARRNVDAWSTALREGKLDAILVTASGCGSMIKDYGHLLARDRGYATRAAEMSQLTRDISEFLYELGLLPPLAWTSLRVAYHSACSLQHGQRIDAEPRSLLEQAGFTVLEVPEGHICCGSAGTYNMLEPELSSRLRDRKLAHIASVKPDLIATGNIGCITQLQRGSAVPVIHTIELLDWATGGPCPKPLQRLKSKVHPIDALMELAASRESGGSRASAGRRRIF
jgi:glycolate oxidase iron-sulfur subunit